MSRLRTTLLLLTLTPGVSGCVASMAASAIGMAAKSARGAPVSNEGLGPQARAACEAQAAQYGAVHIIDVEQNRVDKIIVWGTVEKGGVKQSFQCDFGRKITSFKLRKI